MNEVLAPAQRRDYGLRNVLDDILALPCDLETKVDLMLAAGASARVVARLLNGVRHAHRSLQALRQGEG